MPKSGKADRIIFWQWSHFTIKEFSSFYLYNNDASGIGELGDKCKHPQLDLRECHYCENYNIILHVFCAARTGDSDNILYCWLCVSTKNTNELRRSQRVTLSPSSKISAFNGKDVYTFKLRRQSLTWNNNKFATKNSQISNNCGETNDGNEIENSVVSAKMKNKPVRRTIVGKRTIVTKLRIAWQEITTK